MSESDPPDNRAVVTRFLAGDPDVIGAALRAAEMVVSLEGHGIPRVDRQDIVQQALLETWEAFRKDGFSLEHGVGCFVRKVAHRRCLDWRRKQRETVDVPQHLPDPKRGPDDDLMAHERDDAATKILEALPPACRRLIEMHVIRQLPYAVIAALTGRSEGALRVEMYGCLKRARETYRNLQGPDRPGGNRTGRAR